MQYNIANISTYCYKLKFLYVVYDHKNDGMLWTKEIAA